MNANRNIIYLSHGGGPLPLLGDPDHLEMVETLKQIAQQIPKPSAILVVSAHWEATVPNITAAATPELIYDYGGFPPESYDIKYPCVGQPELALRIYESLTQAGIEAQLNERRGFDHGLFVPLKIMYPEADIPCVQLSLMHSLNPQAHIDMGRALQSVVWENLLIIGSGFSFHNMRAFFAPGADVNNEKNRAFEDWLKVTMTNSDLNENERSEQLCRWQEAPHARFCHPREEHLLPLHVCYGAAAKASEKRFETLILNKIASMYLWSR